MPREDKLKKIKREKEIAAMLDLPDPHPRKPSRRDMNARQAKLLEGRLAGLSLAEAAKRAGYNGKDDKTLSMCASQALSRSPAIKAAADKARTEVAQKLNYTLESAMKEAQEAIEFAILTGNANAYVKAVELRSKLQGLLTEKLDIRAAVGFSVMISGIDRSGSGEGNQSG